MTSFNLDPRQIGLLVTALIEKRMETRRYLNNVTVPDSPQPENICCDWHRIRYERNKEQQAALQERYDAETELIALFDGEIE